MECVNSLAPSYLYKLFFKTGENKNDYIMGFMDNVGNEFGKKTGKAIGNKLYGKHADDIRMGSRIDVSYNNSSAQQQQQSQEDTTNYEAIEKAKRKTLEYENNMQLLNNVISVEFNSNDKNAMIKELTTLSSYIDLWIKESTNGNKNLNAAQSKFDAGLAIFCSVDAENPMINYFTNKQLEWSAYLKKKRKTQLIIIASFLSVLAIFIILSLIFA